MLTEPRTASGPSSLHPAEDRLVERTGPAFPFPAGLVERHLGRAPGSWTADDLLKFAKAHGISLVSLMHVGGDGLVKTLDFVPRDEAHFLAILTGGERADGSSLFPGIRTDCSDVILLPRLETAFVDPFSPKPTLAVLCGHCDADRKPLPTSPDTIVRRAHERVVNETGIDMWALGEVEFFLGRHRDDPPPMKSDDGQVRRSDDPPPVKSDDGQGRRSDDPARGRSDDGNYHAASPSVFGEELRRLALYHLGAIGIPVKYGHSEVGAIRTGNSVLVEWEQHEVELGLLPLPRAAEAVMLTAWTLGNLARTMGMQISFEPMLQEGHPGNGLHFHVSPRVPGGGPIEVMNSTGDLTQPARWLIGGLVRLGGTLMAFGNRAPESFARLAQGKEAPTAVTWGHRDRKALIRIPIVASGADSRSASPTVEFRLPDGSAHQHLLLAGMAQALVVGHDTPDLESVLERTAARSVNQNGGAGAIPASPARIAESLQRNRALLEAGQVFPPEVIDSTIAALT